MKKEIQKYLLGVARNVIAEELGFKVSELHKPDDSEILNEKCGVFVTLEIGGELRGCIGNIVPVYPLEEAVKHNAINAAFEDPRFSPLTLEEFDQIEIEVSVLTVPKKLEYKSVDDLLKNLTSEDGVIIKKGYYEATYLPQVWEKVPNKEMFLGSLCMKAGLPVDEWKKGKLEVLTYRAEAFKGR